MIHDFTFLDRVIDGNPLGQGGRREHQCNDQDEADAQYRNFQKFMGSHNVKDTGWNTPRLHSYVDFQGNKNDTFDICPQQLLNDVSTK